MRYGMPSLIEYRTIEEHAAFCAANKLDFLELNLSFPWFQSDKLDVDGILRIKEKYGIDFTLHFNDEINPFSFAPELRRGALDNVCYVLDLAKNIGALKVNMHMVRGAYSAVNGVKLFAYGLCEKEYLGYVEEFIDLCDRKLAGTDIIYCIENTNGYMDYQKHAIELMLRNCHFGLTFDIGHNYKSSEDDESFILGHSDRLCHFHIHDVTERSNHVCLGTGVMDIPRYLELMRGFDCTAVIEVKESRSLISSIGYLKDHEAFGDV